MVVNAPIAGPAAVKRPSSALEDECAPSWDTAPSMMPPLRPSSFHLPFAHYAMVYLDNMGRLRTSESSSIQEQGGTVFTPEVRERFLEILGGRIGYQRPMMRRSSPFRGTPLGYGYAHPEETHGWGQSRRVRRRRASHELHGDYFPEPVEEMTPSTPDMVGLEVGDTEKVLAYYESALKHFQQINCRQIAKAFIKFIEPRKQVKHPYNGGKPPAGAPPGQKGDPEKTKPDWWPAGVQHKEPDHLKKEERLQLLIHIMRKLGRWGITAEKLREVAQDSKRSLRGPEKLEEMEEMLKVRKLEERYERGEVDGSTTVFIKSRETNPKTDKDSDSICEPEKFEADEEDEAEEVVASSSMPTAIEPVPMASRSVQDQHLFSLDTLNFGEPIRHDRSYYAPSSYTDDFNTPAQPFDYISHTSFSTPEEHRPASMPVHPPVNQFDPWTSPFGRQNLFDYSTAAATSAATTQAMAPPSMPYQMPIPTQDLPHHGSRTPHMEPMTLKAPAYPGSLTHSHMMPAHHV
ncbi:uncharacterized protein ACHE_21357S [Aspergillus chevalieri]|uniref:Subtelomeric hrmA-associated cluster protein AFUB-079030/YDR124W-like helical bundle domain-containing protein n=1 Tax=Aspergillus chevalieri TaxID=182096 RepID=A0A7R7VL57_ASPCH|nr:uncharacterized protein ACHE_21357S [Aspergillus chevalieri]BCR85899.1 hypothetical protein ACHE_21357S [Aspergillus chevalieri]